MKKRSAQTKRFDCSFLSLRRISIEILFIAWQISSKPSICKQRTFEINPGFKTFLFVRCKGTLQLEIKLEEKKNIKTQYNFL